MAKGTAVQAIEALRLALIEQSEIRLGAANRPGIREEIKARAMGEGFALQEIAEQIATMQAEGFSDPDPVAEADTALSVAQSCLRLNAMYQHFWDGLTTQFGEAVVQRLVKLDPMAHGLALHWSVVSAIVTEQTPEQHAHMEQMFTNMQGLLDTVQAQVADAFSGSVPIQ